jgi:hypothetical protein
MSALPLIMAFLFFFKVILVLALIVDMPSSKDSSFFNSTVVLDTLDH